MSDLHVSLEAAELIVELTDQSPGDQALRIDLREESNSLVMSLADEPHEADTVIGEQGVLVYLDPAVTERLEEKTLQATSDGHAAFFVTRD